MDPYPWVYKPPESPALRGMVVSRVLVMVMKLHYTSFQLYLGEFLFLVDRKGKALSHTQASYVSAQGSIHLGKTSKFITAGCSQNAAAFKSNV